MNTYLSNNFIPQHHIIQRIYLDQGSQTSGPALAMATPSLVKGKREFDTPDLDSCLNENRANLLYFSLALRVVHNHSV